MQDAVAEHKQEMQKKKDEIERLKKGITVPDVESKVSVVLWHDLCKKGWYTGGIIFCLYKNVYCTCTLIKNAEKQIEQKYIYFLKIISGIRECRYNE